MMDLTEIIKKMLLLVLLVLVGFFANKKGMMDQKFSSRLSRFLLDIAVPAVLLSSGMSDDISFAPKEVLYLFLLALIIFAISGVISFFVPAIIKAKPDEAGTYRVLTAFPNSIFMGYPMVAAFFGSIAIIYPAIFAIPFNIALFSISPIMFGIRTEEKIGLKDIFNSCTIFSALAMVLILLPFQMPQLIKDFCGSLGGITSPLALVIIGSNLADISLKDSFRNPKMYLFSLFRLIILPIMSYFLLRPFVTDRVVLGCATIMAGLPSAATATLLAAKYGGGESLSSQGVVMTTVFSVITIPMLMLILFQ